MKSKTIILIAISLLLQSCYSYKVIDKNSNLTIGKKYKIKQANKYEKVRLLASTDSTLIVIDNKEIETTITKKDIRVIKKGHFSFTKSAALYIGVTVGVSAAAFASGAVKIGPDFSK
jgi:hypothetical protein